MNVLIVEDEAHTAALLQEIIEQDSEFIILEKLESIAETVQYLSKYQQNLDLLFFDIQLADGQSFEIFRHIDVVVPIVFCTAYDEYTLQAIKNNGIDYILKPFKESEIHEALQKYKKLLSNLHAKKLSPIHFQQKEKQQFQKNFLTQFREKTVIKKLMKLHCLVWKMKRYTFTLLMGRNIPCLKNWNMLSRFVIPASSSGSIDKC